MKVVDDLCEYPGPVDRIDSSQLVSAVDLRICEQCFDDILAVVKGTFDADIMDVFIKDSRHLRFLNGRNLAFGMKHED